MNARWLITPYFFEMHDGALAGVLPSDAAYQINNPPDVTDRSPQSLARLHQPIAEFVRVASSRGDLAVSVAGDCSASLPVMAGLQAAGLSPLLVWLDAHGDFNTSETSPSGFLGGMPLAMMVGRGDLDLPRASGLRPVPEDDVWLVDARDLDPLERKALAASRVTHVDLGALSDLPSDRPIHLHIDNDIMDAAFVPANNYPVRGGPKPNAVSAACTRLARQRNICAISFSGWNGTLDRDGATGATCAQLLASVVEAATSKV